MGNYLKILGNGQIWDVRGLDVDAPEFRKTFEDLFSGRALGEAASRIETFSRFKEKGRVTGYSVTKALLSHDAAAKKQARIALGNLAKNGASGIETLSRGKGYKQNWPDKEKNYWKNIDIVVIGGGVSEQATGRFLINAIKKELDRRGLSRIRLYQARFPGKESGILGAVINIISRVTKDAKHRGLRRITAIGLDIGRDDIGSGLLEIDSAANEVLPQKKPWLYKTSVKTPHKRHLKKFLDSRADYPAKDRRLGEYIRGEILNRIADLIVKTEVYSKKKGLKVSANIAVAVPGSASVDGFILDSTDYLPFFRKKDGFNFARALEAVLRKKTLQAHRVYIINDGIAAGIANMHFGFLKEKNKKIAFFGVGSGLGGCLGHVV